MSVVTSAATANMILHATDMICDSKHNRYVTNVICDSTAQPRHSSRSSSSHLPCDVHAQPAQAGGLDQVQVGGVGVHVDAED